MTKELTYSILNRLREFPEWNQCMLMNLLLRWQSEDEDEVYDVLNILDDRLKHANSGVVLVQLRTMCDRAYTFHRLLRSCFSTLLETFQRLLRTFTNDSKVRVSTV